jgi:predicted DNA binding CopG/RHH family protein
MSDNRTKYQTEYKKRTYKRIPLEVRHEGYEIIKKYADQCGMSTNAYIKMAIANQIIKDSENSPGGMVEASEAIACLK